MFVVEQSFAGTLEAKGFEERLIRLAPPPDEPEEPAGFWRTSSRHGDLVRTQHARLTRSTWCASRQLRWQAAGGSHDGRSNRGSPDGSGLKRRVGPTLYMESLFSTR